jgi:hypothetical protein
LRLISVATITFSRAVRLGTRLSPDEIQQRRLAGTAGSDHHEQLALVDVHRHVPQHVDGHLAHLKGLADVFQPQ